MKDINLNMETIARMLISSYYCVLNHMHIYIYIFILIDVKYFKVNIHIFTKVEYENKYTNLNTKVCR